MILPLQNFCHLLKPTPIEEDLQGVEVISRGMFLDQDEPISLLTYSKLIDSSSSWPEGSGSSFQILLEEDTLEKYLTICLSQQLFPTHKEGQKFIAMFA